MTSRAPLAPFVSAWALLLAVVLVCSPLSASINQPAAPAKNPPAETATMAPAALVPEFECYHVAEIASGEVSVNPPVTNHTLQDSVGGAVIGGVAGSYYRKFGRGLGIGALAGGIVGIISDAAANAAWQRQNTLHANAYNKCMAAHGLGS